MMFGRKGGGQRQGDSILADFQNMREFVIDPIVTGLEARMVAIEKQIEANGTRFDAAMRAFNDPTVGMVTRAELQLRADLVDSRILLGKTAHESMCEEQLKPLREDVDSLLRNQLPPWTLGGMAVIIPVIVLIAGHFWR